MTTEAISSFGIQLRRGDGGSPETFTLVGEVRDTTPPQLSSDMEDVTSHQSTNGYEEVIPDGVKKTGEVKFEINYVPTNATHDGTTGLIADWKNGTKRNYRLIWPDSGNTTWNFPAYVTAFEPKAPVKGTLRADVTLKVTGSPTLA